jgi:hypothetical protein
MTDLAALQAIHDAFAVPVEWTQGSTVVSDISAIAFHDPGDDPIGVGRSVRQKGFEARKSDLPFEPALDDQIDDAGVIWRVIDVMDYEEAAAWRVMVEKA